MKYKYTDYHIHTQWSHDIVEFGPSFEDYIKVAEKNKINICFLEHYELIHVESNLKCPFYGDKIVDYLNELDKIKENYEFVLCGLEVEYYTERETKLREFMDDYEKELDFIAGTLHETDIGYPVTTRNKLIKLLQKKSITQIVDNFFELSKKMIESKIFKNICHLDTIWRYINRNDLTPPFDVDISNKRVLELGRMCIKNNIRIEYNLSGENYPIKRPFPSKKVMKKLIKEGGDFFVGSDSHSVNYFLTKIRKVKKAYKSLKKLKNL
ncbi:MAG: PHP domain-containing protein [Promethearchaeota archaeon]